MKAKILITLAAFMGSSLALAAKQTQIIQGALPPPVINKTIKQNLPTIRNCYTTDVKTSGEAKKGNVVTYFVINGVGVVQSVEIKSTTLNNSEVEHCMVEAIKKIKFPEQVMPGATTEVTYPFTFAPSKAEKRAAKQKATSNT